jgi:hypothetical protein
VVLVAILLLLALLIQEMVLLVVETQVEAQQVVQA